MIAVPAPRVSTGFADRLAGFESHWRSIAPELRRIENGRLLRVVVGLLIAIVGAAGFYGAVFGILAPAGENGGIARFVIAVVAAIGSGYGTRLARSPSRRAGNLLREKVARALGLSYRQDASRFPIDTFCENAVLPDHDQQALEDLIFGEIDGVPIVFCDAHLKKEHGSGDGKRTETVFRGPLVVARFPKRAHGYTIVVTRRHPVRAITSGWADDRRLRVRLESEAFERRFSVYSTDQVEARYLLTPVMMERLMTLTDRFLGQLSMSFTGHELLVALDDRRDWFPDPKLFQRLTDPAVVHEKAEELARLAEIVETLKLNAESRV